MSVLVHNFLRKLCYGSKKWRWLNQWMISNLRVLSDELKDKILRYSMRRSLQHWTESSRIPASRKRSVWRKWKLTKKTVSFEEDRLLTCLRVLPGHWSQRFCRELCRPIHCCSAKWWYSRIRFEMGRISIIDDANPIWWNLGNFVQIKNTRVWETQERIGIVQHGDSSEESRTWLSQIENDGKKKYRAESTN